jgi:F0F1-type ATP synthase membrane subunit b/b'
MTKTTKIVWQIIAFVVLLGLIGYLALTQGDMQILTSPAG